MNSIILHLKHVHVNEEIWMTWLKRTFENALSWVLDEEAEVWTKASACEESSPAVAVEVAPESSRDAVGGCELATKVESNSSWSLVVRSGSANSADLSAGGVYCCLVDLQHNTQGQVAVRIYCID